MDNWISFVCVHVLPFVFPGYLAELLLPLGPLLFFVFSPLTELCFFFFLICC